MMFVLDDEILQSDCFWDFLFDTFLTLLSLDFGLSRVVVFGIYGSLSMWFVFLTNIAIILLRSIFI